MQEVFSTYERVLIRHCGPQSFVYTQPVYDETVARESLERCV